MQPKSSRSDRAFKGDDSFAAAKQNGPMYGNEQGTRRKKTESITFRLESEILATLRQEARRKDISVNTLVSQIARQHTSWHSTAAQAGFISVRKALIMKLFESQRDEEIKALADHVAKISNKDFILMLRRRYNIHSALDMIETWIRISGYFYTHSIDDLGYTKLHAFIVQHDMGKKWSLYLGELFRKIFEEFEINDYKFDRTESTLTFEVAVSMNENVSKSAENEAQQGYLRQKNDGIGDTYRLAKDRTSFGSASGLSA